MNRLTSILIMSLALSGGPSALAAGGLSLSQTRVVYPGDQSSIALGVNNSSAHDVWLLRGWVAEAESQRKSPVFIVTPPLYRLDAGNEVQLRINALNTTALPADRESLFYLNVLAIPPTAESTPTSQGDTHGNVSFAINTRIKLFYRPAAIVDNQAVKAAYGQIRAYPAPQGVTLHNPSPYYLTLNATQIDRHEAQGKGQDFMLAPYGELTIAHHGQAREISYQVIGDYGGRSTRYTIVPLPPAGRSTHAE